MTKPIKKKYTLKSNDGTVIEVRASREAEARKAAMIKLHGSAPQFIGRPASQIGLGGWTGRGLTLVSAGEDSDAL